MKEKITKYRKADGRISWGYQYRSEGRQFTKSGFPTKFGACKALGAALAKHQMHDSSPQQWDTRSVAEYMRYSWITTQRCDADRRPSSATVSLQNLLSGCSAESRFST